MQHKYIRSDFPCMVIIKHGGHSTTHISGLYQLITRLGVGLSKIILCDHSWTGVGGCILLVGNSYESYW